MTEPPPEPADTGTGPDGPSSAGMPRWVKVSGLIALVVLLLFLALLLTRGPHNPGRHFSSDGRGAPTFHFDPAGTERLAPDPRVAVAVGATRG